MRVFMLMNVCTIISLIVCCLCASCRSFSTWSVTSQDLKPRELNAFIKSAALTECSASQPRTISVTDKESSWATTITALLLKKGMGPHVTVEGGAE